MRPCGFPPPGPPATAPDRRSPRRPPRRRRRPCLRNRRPRVVRPACVAAALRVPAGSRPGSSAAAGGKEARPRASSPAQARRFILKPRDVRFRSGVRPSPVGADENHCPLRRRPPAGGSVVLEGPLSCMAMASASCSAVCSVVPGLPAGLAAPAASKSRLRPRARSNSSPSSSSASDPTMDGRAGGGSCVRRPPASRLMGPGRSGRPIFRRRGRQRPTRRRSSGRTPASGPAAAPGCSEAQHRRLDDRVVEDTFRDGVPTKSCMHLGRGQPGAAPQHEAPTGPARAAPHPAPRGS